MIPPVSFGVSGTGILQDPLHKPDGAKRIRIKAVFPLVILFCLSLLLPGCKSNQQGMQPIQSSDTPLANAALPDPDDSRGDNVATFDDFTADLDAFLSDPDAATQDAPTDSKDAKKYLTQAPPPAAFPDSGQSANQPTQSSTNDNNPPDVVWVKNAGRASANTNTKLSTQSSTKNNSAIARNKPVNSIVESTPDTTVHATMDNETVVRDFDFDELMYAFSGRLLRAAAYSDNHMREYLAMTALTILDPDKKIDPDQLYDLDQRQRELIKEYQGFFLDISKQMDETSDPEILVKAANTLAGRLGSQDPLHVRTFRLCTAVRNWGNYDEFESLQFISGRSHELITYVEVENFTSVQNAQGNYSTRLTQEVELYFDADGTLVYSEPAHAAEDVCRNTRKDFFLVRHIVLPHNLSVGKYQLKVRIVDEHSQAEAEAIIPITIIASARR